MDPAETAIEENRRLRQTMRDLVALSTLPAVWIGLGLEGVAGSLADALFNTLSLDLIYVRLTGLDGQGVIEVARSKHSQDTGHVLKVRTALAPLLNAERTESPATILDPFGAGTLHVTATRFGVGDDYGILITGSRKADFPTEQDRLLLGVGANQTAIVVQRRRAEEQVRQQQEWLRVTLASIGDAVIATDTQGHVTFLNGVAQELTGWMQEEAQGRPLETVFVILNEQTRQPVESPVKKVLRDGAVVGLANHTILIAKGGAERPIDDSAAPIRDDSGKLIGVVLIFRDVTEQRRTERTLRQSEERFARFMQSFPGLAWIKDSQGRYVYANAAALTAFGVPQPDLYGKTDEQVFPSRTAAQFKQHDRQAVTSGENIQVVEVLEHPGGALHHSLVSKFPIPGLDGRLALVGGMAIDISDRLRAEEALRQSEEHLRAVVETTPACIKVVAPDGTLLDMNSAGLAMVDADGPENVKGKCVYALVCDEYRDAFREFNERVCRGEKGSLEFEIVGLRGTRRHMETFAVPLRWPDGGFVQLAITHDITARKRAEAALRESEGRFRGLMEQAPFSIQVFSPDGRSVRANRAWEELWGVTLDQIAGYNVLEDKQLEDKGVLPLIKQAFDGVPSRIPAIRYDPNETIPDVNRNPDPERWVAAVAYPLKDESGNVREVVLVHEDITARRRAEAALQESEERLRLLADSIPQLAWMARPDGHIFWYNRRWYEYTGTTPEQMEGWGWQSVHDPDVLPKVLEQWKGSIASGEPFDMVFPLKSSDDQFRLFLTRVNPLRDEAGCILYWFGTNTDITEIKRMEAALRDADRRKDEFLATLAHELRNPLAPIRNSLQILKMPRVDAATVQQTRDMMERQVHHLVRLVDDLLDVSRVMRGKIELRREPVELATIVARAVETAQPLIEVQGHQLDISLTPDSLLLDADPVRLAQVIGNLLTNSAKYTEANGNIWLTAARENGQAILKVRDSGIGIGPDMLPHVFELFVQVDHASTKAQGGLGIGLTLVKNLVEMHGGTVDAHSAGPGKGCEFVVRLPLMVGEGQQSHDKGNGEVQQEPSRPSGHRLLVVDDNQDAAVSLAMLLRLQGHEVRVAHTGPAALEMTKGYVPDVVFLDIGMPGMDGYEVARRLRQQPGLENVVLAALTGWGQQEDRRRTAEAGFDHHLVKPPEPKAVDSVLAELKNRI